MTAIFGFRDARDVVKVGFQELGENVIEEQMENH